MSANLSNAVLFLLDTVFQLYLWVVLMRLILQWVRADFYHPVSQFVWQVTQPPLKPLHRIIPRWGRLDVAALLLALLTAFLYVEVVGWLLSLRLTGAQAAWYTVLKLLVAGLNLYTVTLFAQAFFSWLGPGINNPAGSVLWSVNEPLLRPVRRVIPPLAGLDLAPLVVILALQFVNQLVPISVFR